MCHTKYNEMNSYMVGFPTEKVQVCMQNKFISVISSRPILDKIETIQQIGKELEKICTNTISKFNHKCKYKKMATWSK